MKKILFVVCTHGDELAGLNLFWKYPYGKNHKLEWKILVGNPKAALLNSRYFETDLNRSFNKKTAISYEEKRAEFLKSIMAKYDVVYDIHTTTDIRPKVMWNRCLFINDLKQSTLSECDFIDAKYLIWDKDMTNPSQFLPYHAKTGITLEYVKTGNVNADRKRMEKDFWRIIDQKKISKTAQAERIICQADIPVTQKQKRQYNLELNEFVALTDKEKKLLKLDQREEYYPIFINTPEVDPLNYCFLNKRLKSIKNSSQD